MSASAKNWFEVDTKGLRTLYAGKSKTFILRELIQNAWDEEGVTKVNILMVYSGRANSPSSLVIEDDSPTGFRNIADAYTLFRDCYKRDNPEKRGRFNLGEKQVFSVCDSVELITTTGHLLFDKEGRHSKHSKRESGSQITLMLKLSKEEFDEMLGYAKQLLTPPGITTSVNGIEYPYKTPKKSWTATLLTEGTTGSSDEQVMNKFQRKTTIEIFDVWSVARLYEMGIPVCEIDCDYNINIGQRIPLNMDRETVSASFLKDVYAEVLNHTHDEITEENASSMWVRTGASDERAEADAIKSVLTERFGEKFAIANPFDPLANDDAIANGYKLVSGSEMSADEWARVKENSLALSSSQLFPHPTSSDYKIIAPSDEMRDFASIAAHISNVCLGFKVKTQFVDMKGTTPRATYSRDTHEMTVYYRACGKNFFDRTNPLEQLKLIIHELGHEGGHHTEEAYHRTLTEIAAKLALYAAKNPKWLDTILKEE